ncbi:MULTISPECIES: DinB family protein [Streptomyces]|uniref:DinB family protein n=1 Tax=Streptomyces doebereineriae TaxID=3075528 RepID=A0ABU2VBY4_9ACTN|nr:DinB family protein [Streptomyces sp. DSM 41640]MDT0482739.1 DinB family protein [Streptomyces sp. DSM 41640]
MFPRTDTPPTFDERATLVTFLDYVRATVHAKCEGLSDEDARKALLPESPLMTVAGLVSHVHWVENYWISVVLLGGENIHPGTEEDPDREFRIALDVPLAQLLDAYEKQCAEYRELVVGLDLETRAALPISDGRHVTLRWVLMHLVEEIARHNGHIDILRELADGVTGA